MHRAAALAVLLALAGCSDGPAAQPGPGPVPPVCAGASGTGASGTGVAALGPVMVGPDDTAVSADVGRALFFVDGTDLTLAVDDPSVVAVLQPRSDGSAQYTAGGQVLAPGRATITVTRESGGVRTVVVTAACAAPR